MRMWVLQSRLWRAVAPTLASNDLFNYNILSIIQTPSCFLVPRARLSVWENSPFFGLPDKWHVLQQELSCIKSYEVRGCRDVKALSRRCKRTNRHAGRAAHTASLQQRERVTAYVSVRQHTSAHVCVPTGKQEGRHIR